MAIHSYHQRQIKFRQYLIVPDSRPSYQISARQYFFIYTIYYVIEILHVPHVYMHYSHTQILISEYRPTNGPSMVKNFIMCGDSPRLRPSPDLTTSFLTRFSKESPTGTIAMATYSIVGYRCIIYTQTTSKMTCVITLTEHKTLCDSRSVRSMVGRLFQNTRSQCLRRQQ